MSEMVINNVNIEVERPRRADGRWAEAGASAWSLEAVRRELLKRIDVERRRLIRVTCSGTWAEDCLYRGAEYVPDFRCECPRCRRKFSERLHPRPIRQTNVSDDCQLEMDDDPEFREEFEKLRNAGERVGSILVARGESLEEAE